MSSGWKKVEADIESGPAGTMKWIMIIVLVLTLFGSALNWIMKPAGMAVDRIVQKNSFQYKEGMEQRAAILQANIAEVDILLAQNPVGNSYHADLVAQKRILNVQLKAITINQ